MCMYSMHGTDIAEKVVNMSLTGGRYQVLNDVVAAAVRGGLAIVVAAGNSNEDASNFSPASEPLAYTVGSIEPVDTKSDFSNWGKRMIYPPPIPSPPVLVESALTGTNSPGCLGPRPQHHQLLDPTRQPRHKHHQRNFHGISSHRRSRPVPLCPVSCLLPNPPLSHRVYHLACNL